MRFRRMKTVALAVLGAGLLATAGCGGSDGGAAATPSATASSAASGVQGTVKVLAAASLTGSFTQLGKDFEAANPGSKVTFSFAGSSQLAQQITSGAPADVFAAASPATMKTVTDAGDNVGAPKVFVRNQLVIAVPKGNPKGITDLPALTKPGVKVALCAEQVPCGAAAKKALAATGVNLTPVTLEQDVKSALSKVTLGEVDAALVYRTDVKASAGKVDGVEFPESAKAINDYPIVALKNAPNAVGATAFVNFILSDKASTVLTNAGFQAP
ncbi:ABC-type molybdate transport system, periplasmic component [Frankia casuarinae]|uniref:Molybdenum ABC transporter, periplasmic molybdate-binding protein n=2 Tax=Frankiaceae TaxID=74712 RepID=Q2JAC0_FRACC|nr:MULTISPECIES: molybdate ABC transporter substrate-binding protein [Frankia]ABD11772.1 molybdenum ABC transporter, periplasmic molybdate-binding protein [Frankia casuarinae]EYT93166.1 ABC-type molybdate transport system, periplasmic component [Frankia casuarinae]KDA42717.1 ABC-type molybdate transport system, periplasmic component [Frankia sp. BMG5.23]KEZ35941.1 molybdenum ABC transporter, periplasmic molybdate-binding protein [Frankia sp. CeD]